MCEGCAAWTTKAGGDQAASTRTRKRRQIRARGVSKYCRCARVDPAGSADTASGELGTPGAGAMPSTVREESPGAVVSGGGEERERVKRRRKGMCMGRAAFCRREPARNFASDDMRPFESRLLGLDALLEGGGVIVQRDLEQELRLSRATPRTLQLSSSPARLILASPLPSTVRVMMVRGRPCAAASRLG